MMRFSEEKPMKRNASAHWEGGLKDGKGTISTESGVLANTQYSFGTRFESGKGTNPEELIGAAHAAFLLLHPQDGRVFFVIPWMGKTLLGTTDTESPDPPDVLRVTPEMLEATNVKKLLTTVPVRKPLAQDFYTALGC
jgi:hypothetical protein